MIILQTLKLWINMNKKSLDFIKSIYKYNQDYGYSRSDILIKMRQTGFIYNNFLGDLYGLYIICFKRSIKVKVPEKGLVRIIFEKKDDEIYPKLKVLKSKVSN